MHYINYYLINRLRKRLHSNVTDSTNIICQRYALVKEEQV